MRFESRELKGYAEPVNANRLVEGEFYFTVQFADERLLVPIITTWVFLGRKLDPDYVEETLYFQDVDSYQEGAHYGSPDTGGARFCVYAENEINACDLPKELDNVIEAKFPGTSVVTPSDLNEDDKHLFQKGHADSCPGLVKLDFYGDGKPTFALALTTKSRAYPSTKLVLAHRVGADWDVVTLDKADGPVPVIWSEKPGEYTGVYKNKIRATGPVIIFCGYSSWAVLYAWVNNKVAQIQLQD